MRAYALIKVYYNKTMKKMAITATLHCLLGCAVGELIGVTIGTHAGFGIRGTISLAFVLSFIGGYSVSTWPLVRGGMQFFGALKLVFAADTLSILTMTIVDNIVMASVPGAMDKDLSHPVYWASRTISLVAAFIVATPVNYWLLQKGKGHALTHQYMHKHHTE